MATREITPGKSKVTLDGVPNVVNGDVSVIYRPDTAAEAVELVNELGGASEFEVVDKAQGWIRWKHPDASIEIMGPSVEETDAGGVVSFWDSSS